MSKLQEYARLYFLKERERNYLQNTHEDSEIQYRMLLKEREFMEDAKGGWFFMDTIDGEIGDLHKRVESNPFDVLFEIYEYWVKHERDDPRFKRCDAHICVFRHCKRFSYGTPLDHFGLALKWFWNDGQVCGVVLKARLRGYEELCDLLEKWL